MVSAVGGRFSVDAAAHIKDGDGDGLPDSSEKAGWPTQRGDLYITDPSSPDTDGDGLPDGDEAGALGMTLYGQAYAGHSDPTELGFGRRRPRRRD